MNEALKQLRDLHLPAEPGWWPPAPGWWLLAAAALWLVSWLGLRLYRRWRRQRPFRTAMTMLDGLLRDAQQQQLAAPDFAHAVNALLKRALIYGARRSDAAPLTGTAWLVYLDQLCNDAAFSKGAGAALGNTRFAPSVEFDAQQLHRAARAVLRKLQSATPV